MSFIDFTSDNSDLLRQIFEGAAVGVVADIDDPEKLGRVKVKLPMLLKDKVTFWARVAVPFAGKKRGFFMMPEVGEEVLVIFGGGDISDLYIVGSLYNNEEKPVEYKTEDGKYEKKRILFREGQEININEKSGEAFIEIKTKNDNSLFINDKDDGEIIIKTKNGKNKIIIDGNTNKIRIESDESIVLKSGESKVELNAKNNEISISSDTKLTIKSSSIVISSSGNLDIKSDGTVNIKGSMVKVN